MRYGADAAGVRDSTVAFNLAFKAASFETNCQAAGAAGGVFKITSPLIIDSNKVGFDGLGCLLDCSSATKGKIWAPAQSATDVNRRPLLNASHPVRNFIMQGPGMAYEDIVAVYIGDSDPSENVAGLSFQNVGFQDWGRDVEFDDGAFCTQFINCSFGVTVGSSKKNGPYSISSRGGAKNAGERQDFIGCSWYNKPYILDQSNGNSDIFLTQCSIDGFVRAVNCVGGNVFIHGSHFESPGDTDYWIYSKGGNIFANQIEFVLDGDKTEFDLCYSDVTNTDVGIFLRDCFPGFGLYKMSTYVVGGGGYCRVDNMPFSKFGARPPVAKALSTLAYGDFESEDLSADWMLGGNALPALSSSQRHGSSRSLGFATVGWGDATFAIHRFRCSPGQIFTGEFWYYIAALAGGKFALDLQYLDAANRMLKSGSIDLAGLLTWTRVQYSLPSSAPPGTMSAQLRFSLAGGTTGKGAAFICGVVNCTV